MLTAGATVAALVVTLAPPAQAAGHGSPAAGHHPRPPAVAGAPGAGDPYFPLAGNGGFDVTHYTLDIRYSPPAPVPAPLEGTLDATATIRLTPIANLYRFDLDLRGLTVRSITVGGRPATWTRSGTELVITPRATLRKGHPVTAVIRYGGTTGQPTDIEGALYGWVTTPDGAMVASEPDGADTWFPVSDHPTDKAAYDFRITVPRGLVAVANGDLLGRSTRHGWTTWRWRAREPMASYLATATIGNFDLRTSRTPSGLLVINAVDRDLTPEASAGIAKTGEMIAFYEKIFGRYPFSSAGNIVDDDSVDYALETQTRPLYSGSADEDTVAHEQAHQWTGDWVSPYRWADIWLNEGWATYAQWLWTEHDGGATAQSMFDDIMSIPAGSSFWTRRVDDPQPLGLFSGPVYDRGAATLFALREEIGDRAFLALTHQWTAKYGGRTASTADFERLAAHVAHRSLNAFFDTWLRTPARPTI